MQEDSEKNNEIFNLKLNRWIRLSIVCAVLFNLLFYSLFHYSSIYEFEQIGAALTEQVSQSMKIWIGEQRKSATLISIAIPLQNWMNHPNYKDNEVIATRYLKSVANRYNQFEEVRLDLLKDPLNPWSQSDVSEASLNSITISSEGLASVNLESKQVFEQILNGKSYYMSSIFRNKDSNKPVFYFSVPVIKNNQVNGILTFKIRMANFTELIFQSVRYKNTGYVFLIDDRGQTIAHINKNYILSEEQYLVDIVNQILTPLKMGENFLSGKFQGDKKYYYGVDSGLNKDHINDQWYILFTQKENEVLTQANRFFAVLIIATIIMLGILHTAFKKLRSIQNKIHCDSIEQIHREQLEEQLRLKKSELVKQLNYDQLTGIGHFQSIMRVLEQQVTNSKHEQVPLTLVLCHVDQFDVFNENEGYPIGDIFLNFLAKTLKEFFDEPYAVGRVNGNVFAVVLKGRTLIEGIMLIEQFKEQYALKGLSLIPQKPFLSFALVQWEGENHNVFFAKGEKMIQKAKKEGFNQVKY